mmetsp:Transcript_8330/g.12541  ORF Transcript_8330/g.12541 Transcript_8330/m.12541 type:complete len:534 (-) Transcript_8330:222-1823(-)|eukprot:CAMPEP_0203679102 /NCGR_PEP_ID=MMETSP0090-20130426/34314_1 /ASSEMBLY_ACC=CAM_ASM_001088 /TAXON_ID=426623 /ORGANISM="Chaetoceros affinis, Strain CCMP159" /LENGTH=533 /DNA_ID=CAMNT_0050546623 /DNA_START=73 /DNA_END=1674 /DNA_ORIENTATION=-
MILSQKKTLVSSAALLLVLVVYSIRRTKQGGQNESERKGEEDGEPAYSSASDTAEDNTTIVIPSYDEVIQLREAYYSGSVSVSYSNSGPLMIMEGRQCHLIDHTGRKYLDTRNNVAHVGHQNPNVIQAIIKQVSTLNTNSRYIHPNGVLLAKRLLSTLPPPLTKVFYVNSGSEANDLALRLARAYSNSKNCIFVDCAYHGHTLSTLEVSPYKFDHSKEYGAGRVTSMQEQPNGYKTPGKHLYKVPCPDTYRGLNKSHSDVEKEEGKEHDYAYYVEEGCRYFVEEKNEKVGAFIIEGGMSVGGVILPPQSYLKRCAKAIRAAGGLYIADEVQTGFGRLGSCFWAFQYNGSDVVPDIVTVGKPFGNGLPLAAVITTKEVSDAFESMGVEYFNTFGGNPVSCAAGLAVLDEIEKKGLQHHALITGQYLISRFEDLKQSLPIIGDVRGCGLFVGLDLIKNNTTLEPATKECSFLCSILKEKYAVLTSIDGPFNNVLVIKPPMCFSKTDVDTFVSAFEAAVVNDLSKADLGNVSKTPT